MYEKYYIEKVSNDKWHVMKEPSDEILMTFKSKKEAIEYVDKLCKDGVNCTVIVNDKSTYCVSITCEEDIQT